MRVNVLEVGGRYMPPYHTTRMIGYCAVKKLICLAVSIEYWNVTEIRQTDRIPLSISRVSMLTCDKKEYYRMVISGTELQ